MTQSQALTIMLSGRNVLLTGEPGAGKSHTVNTFVEQARAQGKVVAITASTGIAATHIGGITIHSWSGMGIKAEMTDSQIGDLLDKPWIAARVSEADVLIIDEVSMLPASAITLLDSILRRLKGLPAPFGGMQIIFVGDFFQLPPVSRDPNAPALFAFESPSWVAADLTVCYLTEQHRTEDRTFIDVLKQMRAGNIPEIYKQILRARLILPDAHDKPVDMTQLFTHNSQVDKINDERLAALPGPTVLFKMKTFGLWALVDMLRAGCMSPETLSLKIGARVMFTKNNFDKETGECIWVNGTIGIVAEFCDGLPVIETIDGKRHIPQPVQWAIEEHKRDEFTEEIVKVAKASITQLPLRLAWAITVHKSQGMSLDSARMDLSRTFEYGQGYVALSRVRSLAGVFFDGLNSKSFMMHPKVVEFDKKIRSAGI